MQVVGYHSGVSDLTYEPTSGVNGAISPPALVLADNGTLRRESLEPGRELAYTLETRHCAGQITNDQHNACTEDDAPYCPGHTDRWPCARCTGECDRPIPACREDHAVYLAVFAPTDFKVGVTRLHRLYTRLREQGADRAAHIHSVSDGRIARRIERDIANGLPDRVPMATKINGLHRRVDTAAWQAELDNFDVIESMTFEYGLSLTDQPVAETLATGRIRGTKGRILILENNGNTYAVDLRDLVGYELSEGATERELQASLQSFG